jgi:hypothetical protein
VSTRNHPKRADARKGAMPNLISVFRREDIGY